MTVPPDSRTRAERGPAQPGLPRTKLLLATKLYPPDAGSTLIQRQRLLDIMERGCERKLTLVTAPAGYGKTTLLVQWHGALQKTGRSVAWLSLDPDDNEFSRFTLNFIEALRTVIPSFGASTRALLLSGAATSSKTVKAAFLRDITDLNEDIHLFVDDYQFIDDPLIVKMMGSVVSHVRSRFHLVIAGREVPFLPLARLRMLGHLLELTWEDLRFSLAETTQYFAGLQHQQLPFEVISGLNEKTEGWIAGLQLASISLNHRADVTTFFQEFSGQNRNITEFLAEDVFRRQPPDIQEFLLKTSVLKRLSASLCDAVLQRSDSREILERVEGSRLFLFSLDQSGEWYRYHHLFAEFLETRLKRSDPRNAQKLRLRACDWYLEQGHFLEAIDYAFRAGTLDRAAQLLSRHDDDLWRYGAQPTFMTLTGRLPDRLVRGYPRLRLNQAFGYLCEWRFEEARTVLSEVREFLTRETSKKKKESAEQNDVLYGRLRFVELMVAMFADDSVRVEDLALKWHKEGISDDPFLVGSIAIVLARARRELFRPNPHAEAEAIFASCRQRSKSPHLPLWWQHVAGCSAAYAGDLAAAEQNFKESMSIADAIVGGYSPHKAMSATVLADVYYEQNRIAEADELVKTHMPFANDFGMVEHLLAGYVTASRIALLKGDPLDAVAILDEGMAKGRAKGFARLTIGIAEERIRQCILVGEAGRAFQVAKTDTLLGPIEDFQPGLLASTLDEKRAVARIRLAGAEGAYGDAIKLARAWIRFIGDRPLYRPRARLHCLLAANLIHRGENLAAERELRQALELAVHGPLIRTFLDEGEPLISALAEIGRSQSGLSPRISSLLNRVLDTAQKEGALRRHGAADTDAIAEPRTTTASEPLTSREVEILALVSCGFGNDEIAAELSLSRNTVKWHLRQIFDKLGVRHRFQAVRLAQRLGYLSYLKAGPLVPPRDEP